MLLARQFGQRLTKDRIGDAKRVATEFDVLAGNALGYQRRLGLGVLGTSSLVNTFQWALIEDGYPMEFAQEIGKQLAVKLAADQ
jgi:hypothetical protein